MHGNEKSCPEVFDKLTGTARIAIADTSIHREYHQIEVVGDFADILQFAQVAFLFLGRVDIYPEFLAVYQATVVVIGQEAGIPIVEVAGMEDVLAFHFHYPGDAAIGASGGGDAVCASVSEVILPDVRGSQV